jgi:RimJ/RimL family protein N-acetyltransferase
MEIDIVDDTGFNLWEGKKVRLRAVRESDWEQRNKDTSDSNGFRLLNFGVELPKTEETDREFIREYVDFKDTERRIMFSIEALEGEHVGGINPNSVDYKNGTFSVGLRIYRPFRKNGYGEEAFRTVLRYAFVERRLQKCNSGCVSINEPSIRVHKKIGFKEEGLRRRCIYMNGRYYDDLLFGLTREEFEENESILD